MSKHTHTNAITGLAIKASNVGALDAAMQSRRYVEPKWATIQQWKGTGAPVRRGENGVTLEGASGFKWRVFNVAQTAKVGAEAPRAAKAIGNRQASPTGKAHDARSRSRITDGPACSRTAPISRGLP